MKKTKFFFLLAALFAFSLSAAEPSAVLTKKGLQVTCGTAKLTLEYPELLSSGKTIKPLSTELANNMATLKYPGGQILTMRFDGKQKKVFAAAKGLKKNERFQAMFYAPLAYAGFSKWAINGKNGIFPKEVNPKRPFFCSGHSSYFKVTTATNDSIQFNLQGYWQAKDNRAWKWNVFCVVVTPELRGGTWTIGWDCEKAGKRVVLVDKFGQWVHAKFPSKVRTEQELRDDVARDAAYYGAMKPLVPGDKWGGLAGSKAKYGLKATGFFHVEKVRGRYLFVTPDGNAFFQIGCCVIGNCEDYTYIRTRESIYEWLPPMKGIWKKAFLNNHSEFFSHYIANWIRKTNQPFNSETWQPKMIYRLKQLGFNSHGGFSGNAKASRPCCFASCPFLTVNENQYQYKYHRPMPGMIPDPFDPYNIKLMDELFRKELPPRANDPLILGYFSGCERHYNDVAVNVLKAKRSSAKEYFADMMKKKYKTIQVFNQAWGVSLADFKAIPDTVLAVRTESAFKDAEAFQEIFLETYYKLIHDTFRRYDKNHLWIGDRYLVAQTTCSAALKAAGKYMDVFSINYYAREFDNEMLTQVARAVGKPILLSEWSYGSPEQGQLGVVHTPNEDARGKAYTVYVENAASNPWVVGVQWFTLIDQSVTGKWFGYLNSEAMNTGLINVADRPYKTFHKYVQAANRRVYDIALNGAKPAAANISEKRALELQIAHIKPENKIDATFHGWQTRTGEHIYRAVEKKIPIKKEGADFWGAWDEKYLYIFVQVADPTPAQNPGKKDLLWNGDGIELFFGPDVKGTGKMSFYDRQLCIAAAGSKTPYQWYNSGKKSKVDAAIAVNADGYAIEARIPWSEIGFVPASGKRLHFDIAVDYAEKGNRVIQLMWNGKSDNYYNRGQWGTLILVP